MPGFRTFPSQGILRSSSIHLGAFITAVLVFACVQLPVATAGQEDESEESHQVRAQRLYREAKSRYEENPSDPQAVWEFARACYDMADLAADNARREQLALEGIKVCRLALQKHPAVAPVHYYMALNIGQEARTKTLRALGLVVDMEKSLLRVIELDAKFDFAGAHRAVGILYRDAPGWPVSIGSKVKARTHLEKALALFPNYPGNHLVILETHLEWGEKARAAQRMDAARKVMKSARDVLTGEQWALSWEEWDAKWRKVLSQLGESESSE